MRRSAGTMLKVVFGPAVAPLAQFIVFIALAVSAIVIVLGMVEPFTDRDRIRYIVAKEQLKEFSKAMEEYRQDCNAYPDAGHGLIALISNPGVGCWKGPYLRSAPHDPWDRTYKYRLDPFSKAEVICYGSDGVAGGLLFAADLSSRYPNQPIPESPLEVRMRRLYLTIWVAGWAGLAASMYVYWWASHRRQERHS